MNTNPSSPGNIRSHRDREETKGKRNKNRDAHTQHTQQRREKGGSQGGSRIFRESEIPRRRSAPVSRLTRKQEPAPEDHPLQSTPHSPLPNLSTLINPFPRVR
ncbi:hypothetical protein CDAR_567731 [Caerostris darwini]|uniref:Transformer n=1 Tax=Caerostris darwini TaxID=1538125 RepID=A0AAV4RNM1_9ARAC|nr:hypothetical protein CDAR_567731 [Caerostris darwini]